MAFHLRAEDKLGLQLLHPCFDVEVVVSDEGFHIILLRGFANLASEFTAVGANADDLKPHLFMRDAGCGNRVCGVAKYEHTLAR